MKPRTGIPARAWAITLVLSLLSVPLAGLGANACDRCPPGCPMHAKHRLPCHQTTVTDETSGTRRHVGCVALPGIAKPGCGHGEQLGGFTLPWGVPAGLLIVSYFPPAGAAELLTRTLTARACDPPEPPPPISI